MLMEGRTDVLACERDGRRDGLGEGNVLKEVLILENRSGSVCCCDRQSNDVTRADATKSWYGC